MWLLARAWKWGVKRFRLLVGEQEMERPPQRVFFSSLPKELVGMVFENLDMHDILHMRQVSKDLRNISKERYVWRYLFLRMVGTDIPIPFYLPKRLDQCSRSDIESSLRRWQGTWKPSNPVFTTTRRIEIDALGGRRPGQSTFTLLPGGRWMIAAYSDGSVWSFDLSEDWRNTDPVTPNLLIPSPFTENEISTKSIQIHISVDSDSDDALGDSRDSHCLRQFTLAVVAAPIERYRSPYTRVDVYRIEVSSGHCGESSDNNWEVGGEKLVLGTTLSSFKMPGFRGIFCCSVLSTDVAFATNDNVIIVMDWMQAALLASEMRPSGEVLPYRYIGFRGRTKAAHLLRGGRILVPLHMAIAVYNWERDCEITTIPPAQNRIAKDCPFVHAESLPFYDSPTLGRPFYLRDSIRVGALALDNFVSLTIAIDGYAKEDVCFSSFQDSQTQIFGAALHACGYHRIVGIRRRKTFHTIELEWDQDQILSYKAHIFPFDPIATGDVKSLDRVLCDVYTNRVVILGDECTSILTPRMRSTHSACPSKRVQVEEEEST